MSVSVTIGNETFEYPTVSDSPGWGEDATDAFVAVVDQLNLLNNINDILETAATISNNIAVPTSIPGFVFNTSNVRSVQAPYNIYRKTDSNEVSESGTITLTYLSVANEWYVSQESDADSGITFSITTAGQVQYITTDLTGTNYSGVIHFSAKTLSI